jgi:hypothetical protein
MTDHGCHKRYTHLDLDIVSTSMVSMHMGIELPDSQTMTMTISMENNRISASSFKENSILVRAPS